jgi:hypothetical protein
MIDPAMRARAMVVLEVFMILLLEGDVSFGGNIMQVAARAESR